MKCGIFQASEIWSSSERQRGGRPRQRRTRRHAWHAAAAVCLAILCASGPALGAEPTAVYLVGAPLERALDEPIGVSWSGRELRDALESLSRNARLAIVLDRRVDPTRRIEYGATGLTLRTVVEEVAARNECGVVWLGATAFVTRREAADGWPGRAAAQAAALAKLPLDMRAVLAVRRPLKWSDLAEPRQILTQLADEAGLRWKSLDAVPFDLLYRASTTELTLADRLSLVTGQFGLDFHIDAAVQTIELRLHAAAGVATSTTAPATPTPRPTVAPPVAGAQVYTLTIRDVPFDKLIEVLRQRHQLDIRLDEAAIREANLKLDTPTNVDVERATLETLLDQAAAPLGLSARRVGAAVEIGPRSKP